MIDYSWFERSDAFYDNAEQAISHKEEDRWLSYLPACTLDTNPPNYYVPGTLPTISSTVQIPTVTLGSADNGCKVTLSCSTPNSIIYYTLDGTTPSAAFSRAFCYTGPFTVDKACTVKAMAVKDGHWDSEVRTYAVTADKIVIRPTAMYLNVETAKLEQGDTLQLKVSMEPATVTDKRITWKSSDTKVATVDSTGKVTVRGGGTTTVTAYATGKTTVKATCKITVPYKITYQLKGGKNNKKNPSTFYNKKITLKEPTRAKYEFLGWYSDSKYKKKVNSIPKTAKQNYTLYAKWQKVSVKKAVLSSVKNTGNKKVVIKYKKVADAKGYEVSYALDRGFKKSLKTKTTNKLSYTVKGLKPGSTYYVRVRAYKLDSTGKKIYGKYSAVKKVKI